ncbi:MAG: proline--tRNA ligase [Roseomonas sp.]|nr:proline--tRNA ligase [Roseomonas sp.]MCA3328476.1 proline--tRNA ligase [Roseomonas sp.]MCA3331329.1 proline--tRNA ligase [Roseomonas sp.]MCA3335919.1 proline--tRNA ligase [Roseomonas sp.]MCA3346760.1 proline--tRNA ligase [Roseomonas sp.]
MRLSRAFLPTLKETPAEAQIASHRLMLRAGLIRQTSAGIYAWLPAGLRVLRRVEQIVREEQDRAGAQEILMPTIQPAELWRESGRYDDYGKEMLRIRDRHEREMLFGPTNEEMVTDIFKQFAKSYRDLPRNLYHIQWKFRDEVRPRFGVMRGREFLMKDAYSFDLTKEGAQHSYRQMFLAYLRTFARMGLKAIPMRADTGPIGGNLSHEFIILAETGESQVFVSRDLLERDVLAEAPDYDSDLTAQVDFWTSHYAATEEMHDESAWAALAEDKRVSARGIEVGHIFYFGTKYSAAMGMAVTGPDGQPVIPEMGSYGIGVSRLVGALIEANHDEAGIKWPDAVAPWAAAILNLRPGDGPTDTLCETLYARLGVEHAVYDDRPVRAGEKFADADLMGFPWQAIIGPRGAAAGRVELKRRMTGEREEVSLEDAITRIKGG